MSCSGSHSISRNVNASLLMLQQLTLVGILTWCFNQQYLLFVSTDQCTILTEFSCFLVVFYITTTTYSFTKKYPVDFDNELKIGDVRYDNVFEIKIKVQLF